MILTETLTIKINNSNIKHYKSIGYNNIKIKDEIKILVSELLPTSKYIIDVKCDICGIEYKTTYFNYKRNIKKHNYYTCQKCSIEKNKKTNLEKFGVEFPTQSKTIIKKREENSIKRHGEKHHMLLEKYKNKIQKTKLEKYNDKNYNNSKKSKQTKLKKYGDENYNNREKSKETCLKKYNIENVSQLNNVKNKKIETTLKNYGVINYSKSYDYKMKNIKYLLNKYENIMINKVENDDLILFCNVCNNEYKINKNILRNRIIYDTILCTNCNPINSFTSSGKEIQLIEFIKENYDSEIIQNSRDIIKPYELDIYLPELKLAFEFNGVYWHNELYKEKNYHLNKTEKCLEKGIQLVYIWEDDWNFKQEIVKSMILNKLGKTPNKIFARKCEIKETDNKLIRDFLDKNHIQGFVGSSIKIGLYYNDELVSLLCFGKKRNFMNSKSENDGEYELLRFCTKLNMNVIGGASKLFKYFIKNYNYNEITTYADRSHSQGNLYETLGFEFVSKTPPNYYYVIDGMRKHRFGFRKDVLVKEGYDKNMTEHEIMLSRKIYRIFDSGSLKYKII